MGLSGGISLLTDISPEDPCRSSPTTRCRKTSVSLRPRGEEQYLRVPPGHRIFLLAYTLQNSEAQINPVSDTRLFEPKQGESSMKPLVKSLFCQGLKELVTEEDFEGVLPLFEFQKKRIAQDPQRTITAVEIFPFRRIPAPVKFVILAAREPSQLQALQRLWEEAYSEWVEAMKGDLPQPAHPVVKRAHNEAATKEPSLTDRLSREVERLKTLRQCATAGRLVEMHCEALSRNDPNVGTEVEIDVLELATGLPRELIRLFTALRTPSEIQGFVNTVSRRDGAIREEMRKDVWVSIHPDNFNYQLPGHTGT